jgi:outer membrane protein assembly factor BamB
VYAFDVNTGRLLWTFATPGAVHNSPLYDNGVIYAVTGDRTFYAINAQTGKLNWKLSIPSYDSVSSPILAGNFVYFGGAHPYAVYAINIQTHQIAWQTKLVGVIGATDDCTPAVANGLVYIEGVTSPPQHTFTVLPPTGTPVQEDLYALDAQTGQIVWTFHEGLGHTPFFYAASTPTVVGNSVYFGSSVTTSFYSVNARTGALNWAYQVAKQWQLPNSIGESGTIADGIVWTGTFGGLLLGLRASDGTVVVQKHLKTAFYAGSPLVFDNTLILGSLSGFVVAMSIPQLLGQH